MVLAFFCGCVQERRRGRCGVHGRRDLARELRADGGAAASLQIQRRHPRRTTRATALRYEAVVHPIRRSAASVLSSPFFNSSSIPSFSGCLNVKGLRPFGVSLLYAGWDPHYQFQLYHSDPSGNYSGWKATCIGANNGTAQSLLKQEYKDDISLDDAIALVLKTLSKTMDSTTLGSEKRMFIDMLVAVAATASITNAVRLDLQSNSLR